MSVSEVTLTVKLTGLDLPNEAALDEVHDLFREHCARAASDLDGCTVSVEIAGIKGMLLYDH